MSTRLSIINTSARTGNQKQDDFSRVKATAHRVSCRSYCSMGPWPGIEPGPAGPQPTVLTPTLPQPSSKPATDDDRLKVVRITASIRPRL